MYYKWTIVCNKEFIIIINKSPTSDKFASGAVCHTIVFKVPDFGGSKTD